MTQETLTGKQVLALLAQDEVPEIETRPNSKWAWVDLDDDDCIGVLKSSAQFRIKPTPQRRLSVTLANGEVVSWPEPVLGVLSNEGNYWYVTSLGGISEAMWMDFEVDYALLAFGNVHLTQEAAQEHADALRKINTQGETK